MHIPFLESSEIFQTTSIKTSLTTFYKIHVAIFSLLSLFEKSNSRLMRSPCCLCVCMSVNPAINFRMPEPIIMKLGMYMMAPEPISTEYFINSSHLSMYSPIVARQRLGKNVTAATNTNTNEELLDAWFSVRSLSYQRKWREQFIPELVYYYYSYYLMALS
jgi:hypothetical protein